jgi:ubiquinone/menaquinone biosynthesis C-methylase UbiE
MSEMNKIEKVKEQYSDDSKLAARIKLHSKYSTNQQGFYPWLFEQYEFHKCFRILELGCGSATQWEGRIDDLPEDCILVLSDYSCGMVDLVWQKYSEHSNVLVQQVDIQDMPFPDEVFDIIIANHMLYHVPDMDKALTEVKRVLKNNGLFYSSTNGEGGMRPYLHDALKRFNPLIDSFKPELSLSFTMQNGEKILHKYFNDVKRMEFVDSLRITETQDLIDWIKSIITFASFSESDLDGLYEFFEEVRIKEGAINIPKEIGLFISRKS